MENKKLERVLSEAKSIAEENVFRLGSEDRAPSVYALVGNDFTIDYYSDIEKETFKVRYKGKLLFFEKNYEPAFNGKDEYFVDESVVDDEMFDIFYAPLAMEALSSS
jgi:hypothetical protein